MLRIFKFIVILHKIGKKCKTEPLNVSQRNLY